MSQEEARLWGRPPSLPLESRAPSPLPAPGPKQQQKAGLKLTENWPAHQQRAGSGRLRRQGQPLREAEGYHLDSLCASPTTRLSSKAPSKALQQVPDPSAPSSALAWCITTIQEGHSLLNGL